jgi:hypothetical protein
MGGGIINSRDVDDDAEFTESETGFQCKHPEISQPIYGATSCRQTWLEPHLRSSAPICNVPVTCVRTCCLETGSPVVFEFILVLSKLTSFRRTYSHL